MMDDLISRQEAIEAIDAVFPVDPMKSVHAQGIALGAALAKTYIEQLPSAQPYTDKELQKIQDLEQSQFDKMYELGYQAGRSAQPDYIMSEWCTDCKEYDQERHCCPRFNNVIRTALQDAQPEIVRCKDCKHWMPHSQLGYDEDNETYHDYCEKLIPEDEYYAFYRDANDFCSYAERREE